MTQPGIPNDYAISTSCYGNRLRTIEDQAFASVAMGFRRLEFGLSESPVPLNGFEDSRRETGIAVGSMVAGCLDPRREHMSGSQLASLKNELRECALGSVRRHARIALHYGCPVVILRGFEVEDAALTLRARSLHTRLQLGQPGEELREEGAALIAEIEKKAHKQAEHLCRSIHTLCTEYPDITFAIEPGFDFADLLTHETVGWVFSELQRYKVAYWHDTGRTHQRAKLGSPAHGEWLDAYASRMVGVHLQDAIDTEVEMPPGAGEVDFGLVKSYLSPTAERVVEIQPSHGRAEILGAIRFLLDKGF